jgi:hypothetical protein
MWREARLAEVGPGSAGNSPRGAGAGWARCRASGPTRCSALGTLSEHQGPESVNSNVSLMPTPAAYWGNGLLWWLVAGFVTVQSLSVGCARPLEPTV